MIHLHSCIALSPSGNASRASLRISSDVAVMGNESIWINRVGSLLFKLRFLRTWSVPNNTMSFSVFWNSPCCYLPTNFLVTFSASLATDCCCCCAVNAMAEVRKSRHCSRRIDCCASTAIAGCRRAKEERIDRADMSGYKEGLQGTTPAFAPEI